MDPLASIFLFLNQVWIPARFVCSFCEAMAGSLSVASTAQLPKVAVVYSDKVGRYNYGSKTLLLDTPALARESSVYSIYFSYVEQYSNKSELTEYNSGLRFQLPT
jgi:hypothetical protein